MMTETELEIKHALQTALASVRFDREWWEQRQGDELVKQGLRNSERVLSVLLEVFS